MDILMDFVSGLCGTFLFLLPGLLLCYILFPKTGTIERTSYALVLAYCLATFLGIVLAKFSLFMPPFIIRGFGLLNMVLIGLLYHRGKSSEFQTERMTAPFILILVLAFLGTLARLYFVSHITFAGDGITSHVDYLIEHSVRESGGTFIRIPNLNFYVGMLIDRTNFIGDAFLTNIFAILSFDLPPIKIFLAVFLLCSFTHIVITAFTRNARLALFGAAVMAIGPGELFHTTLDFMTPLSSYLGVIALFIFFKKGGRAYAGLALIMVLHLMFSYYTGTLVMIIISLGFIAALILKYRREHATANRKGRRLFVRAIQQPKVTTFLLIVLLLSSYIFLFATKRISIYTSHNIKAFLGRATHGRRYAGSTTIPKPLMPYRSKTRFLGLPMISWQDIFLLLLLATFLPHYLRRRPDDADRDIAFAAIPVLLQSLTFGGVNMTERIFSYFTFYALLAVKIPPRLFRAFAILALLVLIPTSSSVVSQRIKFLSNSRGEMDAAGWVKDNLRQIILADERFVSLLVQNGYYRVTGFADNSPYILPIYYDNNPLAAGKVFREVRARYFATTERMRRDYILMLNFPQQPMANAGMYEQYFPKVFDNGDVRIYETSGYPTTAEEQR